MTKDYRCVHCSRKLGGNVAHKCKGGFRKRNRFVIYTGDSILLRQINRIEYKAFKIKNNLINWVFPLI
jgi:hypothetical protein